jgi:hypothetical protein
MLPLSNNRCNLRYKLTRHCWSDKGKGVRKSSGNELDEREEGVYLEGTLER